MVLLRKTFVAFGREVIIAFLDFYFFLWKKTFHKSKYFDAESLKIEPNQMFQDLSLKFAKKFQRK